MKYISCFNLPMIILMLMATLSCNQARAEGTGTHGGEVVRSSSGCYLADFAEKGVEQSPFIRNDIVISNEVKVTLQEAFPDRAGFPERPLLRKLLARKLGEISKVRPVMSDIMLRAISMYSWDFLNFPLPPVNDSHLKVLGKVYQAAVRDGVSITVHKTMFQCMKPENQVGMIFHEIFYGLNGGETSDPIRPLNGFLFSNDVGKLNPALFESFVNKAGNQISTIFSATTGVWNRAFPKKDASYSWVLSTGILFTVSKRGWDVWSAGSCDLSGNCPKTPGEICDEISEKMGSEYEVSAALRQPYAATLHYGKNGVNLSLFFPRVGGIYNVPNLSFVSELWPQNQGIVGEYDGGFYEGTMPRDACIAVIEKSSKLKEAYDSLVNPIPQANIQAR